MSFDAWVKSIPPPAFYTALAAFGLWWVTAWLGDRRITKLQRRIDDLERRIK